MALWMEYLDELNFKIKDNLLKNYFFLRRKTITIA